MYRLNFYNQSTIPNMSAANFMHGGPTMPRGPEDLNVQNIADIEDGFQGPLSRFEVTLHEETRGLIKRSESLEQKIKAAKTELSPEEEVAFRQEFYLLKRSKEMLALIVEQMQKCAANILANFR